MKAFFLLATLCVSFSLTQALQAQEDQQQLVTVKIPFAFEDGKQHFSPGEYAISVTGHSIAEIRGEHKSGFAYVSLDSNVEPVRVSKVTFLKYGDHYFLSQIWVAGESNHTFFKMSKDEKQEMAGLSVLPATVDVAAL